MNESDQEVCASLISNSKTFSKLSRYRSVNMKSSTTLEMEVSLRAMRLHELGA